MKNLKETVKTKDKDGNDLELAVLHPTYSLTHKQQLEHNKSFREALESGCILREALDKFMRQQNLWDDERQNEYDMLQQKVADGEDKLAAGGIKLSEARNLAVEIRVYRLQLKALVAERLSLDSKTAQGQAENHSFNWLLSQCVVNDKDGKQYFKSVEDYYDKANEQATIDCAKVLAGIVYGLPRDYEKNLPENKFLLKYKLVDENLRLVNKDGQYVDLQNKRINEDGYYIDKDDNLIDADGNPITKDGNPIIEFSEFLDDDGEPVSLI